MRAPKKVSSPGLRFECTECGKCCTNRGEYAYVYVNPEEAKVLAKLLDLSVQAFKDRHTFVDGDGFRQLNFHDDRCVFLNPRTNRCRVYAARPTQCRTFPFWRELVKRGDWTQEAHSLCEGVGQGRLHTPEEARARMTELDRYDEE